MIERVAIAVLSFLVLFFGGALLLPRTVQVERSIEIDRPVVTVFTVLKAGGDVHGPPPSLSGLVPVERAGPRGLLPHQRTGRRARCSP